MVKRVLVKKTNVITSVDVKVASISMSFTLDADIFINVVVFYLGVITKCQSSWRTNALNTLSDILYNGVHYKEKSVLCIYNRVALYAK